MGAWRSKQCRVLVFLQWKCVITARDNMHLRFLKGVHC